MGRSKFILGTVILLPVLSVRGQADAKAIYEGNQLYHSGKIGPATMAYKKALEANATNRKGNFNLGNTLYKSALQIRSGEMTVPVNEKIPPDSMAKMLLDNAAENFAVVANSISDKDTLHRAWHNIGNCYLQKKDYRQAVDAYKKSLRFDPKDEETRYNLAYALKHLPPENKGGGGGSPKPQPNQQQQQNQNKSKSEMSKEQAEQLLRVLMDNEKKLQDKRKQSAQDQREVEKDW